MKLSIIISAILLFQVAIASSQLLGGRKIPCNNPPGRIDPLRFITGEMDNYAKASLIKCIRCGCIKSVIECERIQHCDPTVSEWDMMRWENEYGSRATSQAPPTPRPEATISTSVTATTATTASSQPSPPTTTLSPDARKTNETATTSPSPAPTSTTSVPIAQTVAIRRPLTYRTSLRTTTTIRPTTTTPEPTVRSRPLISTKAPPKDWQTKDSSSDDDIYEEKSARDEEDSDERELGYDQAEEDDDQSYTYGPAPKRLDPKNVASTTTSKPLPPVHDNEDITTTTTRLPYYPSSWTQMKPRTSTVAVSSTTPYASTTTTAPTTSTTRKQKAASTSSKSLTSKVSHIPMMLDEKDELEARVEDDNLEAEEDPASLNQERSIGRKSLRASRLYPLSYNYLTPMIQAATQPHEGIISSHIHDPSTQTLTFLVCAVTIIILLTCLLSMMMMKYCTGQENKNVASSGRTDSCRMRTHFDTVDFV